MGEIGMMVSRLHQEGFDLEHMIDEELRAAGFMELCDRTTRTLLQRAAAVEESHAALRRLLDSIDSQLKDYQETVKLSSSVEIDDTVDVPPVSRNHSEKEDSSPKTVIIIDDDEKEYVDVADMSCQATSMDIQNETRSFHEKASAVPLPARTPPSEKQRVPSVPQQQSTSTEILQSYVPIQPAPDKDTPQKPELHFSGLSTMRFSVPSQPVSKPSDVVVSSVSSVTKAPPVIYRTLKPPVASGAPSMTHRVNPLSKSPVQPGPPTMPIAIKTSTANGTSLVTGSQESRPSENSTPSLAQPVAKTTSPAERHAASADTCTHENSLALEKSVDVGPPRFDIGTRVIGQRADGLWYPGVIEKLLTDKQNQPKYRVKFDKGTRGLLSSNHISLESNPDPSVLDVGSRVVALRPRDTAEENASWRKPSTGVYGKLDVLYAGIIAEKACTENKSRFLVFFEDGFAQYLPVKKLHHVYHTGKKVWDEVADHSKEFIQEYLEEFPNRPMVKLRVNQWVKTEWRGQWLKAKVMQIDCSLIKMLFQIDNRSEWLYRGSTRLEPLYSALVDGKISTAKKKRSRKLTRGSVGKGSEPYIDYSITKPCFGVSPYSKTDPKGEEQQRQEEKRQQTQLEQLRQQEQQEERRDKGKQKSTSETSTTATSVTSVVTTTTSSATGSSITVSSAGSSTASTTTDSTTGNPLPQSNVSSSTTSSQGTSQMRPDNGTVSQLSGNCYHGDSGGAPNTKSALPGCGSSSSLSVIQASTARKKTQANRMSENNVIGLQGVTSNPSLVEVNLMDRSQRPQGIEVIELDGDAATGVLRVPVEADDMMNYPLALRKSEYLVPNMDGSILDEFYHGWEAPWLRVNRRDIRSTGLNRAPAFQIPTNDRRKQDVASLIQERLMQNKLLTKLDDQSIGTQIPVVKSKSSVKGPHKCGPHCIPQESLPGEEVLKYNPRAIPLLLKWKREIAQRHPGHKKTVYYRTPCNKRLRSLAETANYLTVTGATNVSIDQFTFDPQISCQNTVFKGVEPIIPDISRGTDAIEISVVNEVDTCYPPPIDYVSKRVLADGVNMVLDPGFLACCDCTDNCQDKSKCSCAQLTIQATAAVGGKEDKNAGYEFRLLKDCIQTGIYECNQNCACGSQCFNRVVQNGIQLRLQVFKTENRGWGLRSLDDIPMGTFVCTYAGQILNEDMANKEGRDFGDEYLAELDHIEVVEKAKEGYESSVSDLEEDDSVIYKTLAGESSTTASASEDSDASSLSGNDSSEADSLFSDNSYSSERNSRNGEGSTINHKRKRRRRSVRKSPKRKRGLAGEESLMVERESKAHCLSNLADEKWCYIALKRNHENQKQAAVFLNKMLKGEGTETSDAVHMEPGASAVDEEEKNVHSSDFDFDDVGETFYQDMKAVTSKSRTENEATGESSLSEDTNIDGNKTKENVKANSVDIIDLTSDNEETESATDRVGKVSNFSLNPATHCTDTEQQVKLEKFDSEHFVKGEKHEKPVEDGESTDSAPSLLSAEDLSKLAAQNPNLTDEPPVLTKMNPARRMTNPLGDTISRLRCRVSTEPLSANEEVSMDLDPLAVESSVDREPTEKCLTTEASLSLRTDHLSEPSSPEMEYVESLPPSPSSLRSDVSKSESVDRRSELSTGSSRRSVRVSKPLTKKDKVKPKIHYSRSLPKQTSGSPTTKLSPTIPSPSGPSLSRQSSVNSKRLSTRLMFGEEHCYVIDAKAYGNCGRYLNHSCSPNLFVQNVFVDTHDLRFPWVAFFTQQNVSAGTELTWDYAYEVGSVKGKVLHCYCGSAECRGRLL